MYMLSYPLCPLEKKNLNKKKEENKEKRKGKKGGHGVFYVLGDSCQIPYEY